MSAREELFLELYGALKYEFIYQGDAGRDRANKLIDDLLHEAAEKIRERRLDAPDGFTLRPEWVSAWESGRDDSADLIDPYVQ